MVETTPVTIWQDQNQSHVALAGLNTDEVFDGKPRDELKSYSDMVAEIKENSDLVKRNETTMKEQIMYYVLKKIYVRVVKPESPKSDVFECMVLPDNTEKVNIHRKELAGYISIQVIGAIDGNKESICKGKFSLDIREKILEQLGELMGSAFARKGLCLKGQLIEADDTVESRNIVQGEVLEMLSAGGGRIEGRHWYRAKRMTSAPDHGDSWSLRAGEKEGLIFKARVDMHFCGVMWTRHHFDKPFQVKFTYRTRPHDERNDDVSPFSNEIIFNSADLEELKVPQLTDWVNQPQWVMDIQTHGHAAVFLAAGTCIEVVVEGITTEPFNIIHQGQRTYYDQIKEQQPHFITCTSREFRGSHTHASQGFYSGIYYRPTTEDQDFSLFGPTEDSDSY